MPVQTLTLGEGDTCFSRNGSTSASAHLYTHLRHLRAIGLGDVSVRPSPPQKVSFRCRQHACSHPFLSGLNWVDEAGIDTSSMSKKIRIKVRLKHTLYFLLFWAKGEGGMGESGCLAEGWEKLPSPFFLLPEPVFAGRAAGWHRLANRRKWSAGEPMTRLARAMRIPRLSCRPYMTQARRRG
jgi:hypothetical protein